jgi:hypothetical protein
MMYGRRVEMGTRMADLIFTLLAIAVFVIMALIARGVESL